MFLLTTNHTCFINCDGCRQRRVAAIDQACYGMAEEAVRLVEESLKGEVKVKL